MLPTDKRAVAGQGEVAEQLADLDEDGAEGACNVNILLPAVSAIHLVGQISRYTNVLA
jgi:hypothetical protein